MKSIRFCSWIILLGLLAVPINYSQAGDIFPWPKKKKEKKSSEEKNKKESGKKDKDNQNDPPQFSQSTPDEKLIAKIQSRPANGSLYTSDAAATDLLSDFRARRIGDLVFVDVIEGSTASVSSSAKRSRDSGNIGGLADALGGLPAPSAQVAAGVITAMGTRKFEGQGNTERKSDLRSRVAARVVEVLPNGDLRIEALKNVKINQETEKLLLSGIVRQRDLTGDNVVPTTAVGNLYVELNGKGVASNDNAPGWLYKFFEKISPF